MKLLLFLIAFSLYAVSLSTQRTYCNPVNIDYAYTPIPDFLTHGKHRATADPVIILYKGDYYLFSTNQWGYWWSPDMLHWNFVARHFLKADAKVYDDLCAPAAWVMNDAIYLFGSTYTPDFPIWKSTNPKVDDWTQAVDKFKLGGWDPAFFLDDDGKLYLYHGSSNEFPTYGTEVDRNTLQAIGEHKELLKLHPDEHGWERFGEYNEGIFLKPFIEGSWMTKHNGKYYLQYGAPGTEFSGYGDGVYVSAHPLGPFEYQSHNPFSYKPGGFARGAGHGATFQDKGGNWWHVSTIAINVKNNFERRIGIWPAGFDSDDVLYCDSAYGDYPTYLPNGPADHLKSSFAGWMLLNYNKPVQVSSTLGGYSSNHAVDENIKTYWSAKTARKGEWLQSDLGEPSTIKAIQINYADQDAEFIGKSMGVFHQYKIDSSQDGKHWLSVVDKSHNETDVPHDYVELDHPVEARYVRITNIHMPTGKFALSGFRVFGNGHGIRPAAVKDFLVLRGDAEKRSAWLKWKQSDDATGYTIYTGVAPDKLYNSIMVYGSNDYYWHGMEKSKPYYFQIEAFNENGISERTGVFKVN